MELDSSCRATRCTAGTGPLAKASPPPAIAAPTAPPVVLPNQNRPAPPGPQAALAPELPGRSASCSDITGTDGGPSAPCVRVPGWTPTEPYNHSRTPGVVRVVQNGKVVELTIPGLDIGKFGVWLDDGVLSVRSWNNLPAPSHVDVDANKCPGHNGWSGWTEPRCEELAQTAELTAAEKAARANFVTSRRCLSDGGVIFSPNDGAITEAACRSVGGTVLSPFDNESRGWCPTTRGCWDGAKWTKIVDPDPTSRCKLPSRSHENDCRPVKDE